MAYKTKFLHFKTKASYEAERAKTTAGSEERKVFDAYISFIDEGPTICTWGKEYQCDANSLSVLPQELTTEEQNQVFKNLGWNVHIISQSDINAGSSPSDEEKAKLLEATALLVKETSNIYLRGNDDSNNHYFFRVSTSSQLEILRLSIITGIIYRITSQFIDAGSIRYDKTQSLTENQKAQARKNIDAASKEEVLPLTIDMSNTSVEDYNTALEAFNSKKPLTIFDSTDPISRFTASVIEKEATTNNINVYFSFTGVSDVNTLNMIGYVGTIKPTGEKTSSFAVIMPSNTDPKPLGQASPGIDNSYSRSDHVHPIQESVAKLTTPRTIALTGAVSGSTTFDGSSNVSINSTLANIDASKITSGTLNADRLPEILISKIPAATSSTYGGIQIGYTTSGKNYAVQLNNGKAYVNVPWTDTDTTYTAGTNISISGTTINCTYTLPTASSSVLGGVKVGSNITLSSGTISLSKSNVTSALGYTPANTSDIPKIPTALPNPYALIINGTLYTGSSVVSISTSKPLSVKTLTSSTVNAGYSYSCSTSKAISTLNGFSSTNPDSVIISSAKLTFTARDVIKMDGLDNLSGTYYIYCLSYMANGKIAVNGAVYA